MFPSVRKESGTYINRKQETPEEQRAFLARPERGKFVVRGESAVAVRRDVSHRIIVGVKQVPQAEGSNPDEDADREAGIAVMIAAIPPKIA
jgi:hypothetical protein